MPVGLLDVSSWQSSLHPSGQVFLVAQSSGKRPGSPRGAVPTEIWTDSLMIPTYFVGLSVLLFLLGVVTSSNAYKSLHSKLFKRAIQDDEDLMDDSPAIPIAFATEIRQHISKHGGPAIFFGKCLQLLGSVVLLGLSVASAILNDDVSGKQENDFDAWEKKGKKKRPEPPLTIDEGLELAMCMFYLYTLLLALISVSARVRWSRIAFRHLNALLVVAFGVYAYRDLFPLATFTLVPLDREEGWILWAKVTILFGISVVVPLSIPRQYIPVDAKNPTTPSPEQTASYFSLATYGFLDPFIFSARHRTKLGQDELPILSDYDLSSNLKEQSFKLLDSYSGGGKGHLFFGLMRLFGWEYFTMASMVFLETVLNFSSPIGINKLLTYLETGGRDTVVRPWFWIILLFMGPILASLAIQWYIFVATRTLTRTEAILTQLVFEHSLRIRMKAETASTPGTEIPAEPAPAPDNISAHDTQQNTAEILAEDFTSHSRDLTLVTSADAQSANSTVKGKNVQKSSLIASTPDSVESVGDNVSGKPKPDNPAGNLVGKINNLVTTDLENIIESRDFVMILVYVPVQVTLCIVFLYAILGWSAFVGLGTIILLFPIPGYLASKIQNIQTKRLEKTDSRIQAVTETMNVIRMIKLFGWERKMNEKVADMREQELVWLWKRQIVDLINGNINYLIPIATMVATYSTYTVIMKEELSAAKVFSSISVFDLLRNQLHLVFWIVSSVLSGKVSLDRMNDFLHNTELLDQFNPGSTNSDLFEPAEAIPDAGGLPTSPVLSPNTSKFPPYPSERRIGFKDATFAWSSDSNDGTLTPRKRNFLLRIDGEVFFKPGCINLVIGPTGSGKTSLLMALLGEMHFMPLCLQSWYSLPREGGIAYAAQESWVQNETIRDNIVFGAPFDEARYKEVITQCCLDRDLELFEAGDQTEVGEKGLTLSGGQKARITLARAIYSQAKIILLDDVLAALDVHTSKWIVEKCFTGNMLEGRTVILVTHNVAMTKSIADHVISLGIDGRVVSSGPISEVLLHVADLKDDIQKEEEANKKHDGEIDPPKLGEGEGAGSGGKNDGKLIVAEEVEEGHVSWRALKLYFNGLGGSHPMLFFTSITLGLFLMEISNATQTWFLGYWASQYDDRPASEVDVFYYLTTYGLLLVVSVALYCSSYVTYVYGSLRASRKLHQQLVEAVLGTTLRWLDITPVSRVITRCTKDIRAVDGPIANGLWWLSEMTVTMTIKCLAVVLFTPAFFLPAVMTAAIGGWIGQIYIAAQLNVKREMSNAKAPVLGHFGAAIAGLPSIRAYGAESRFIQESLTRINRYTRAGRTFYNLNRWVCIRIDIMGAFFASALATYLVYFQNHGASNTGFSLNMAVGFSGLILWWVRVFNDFEVQGNSLERIQGYLDIEQEVKPSNDSRPPAAWPTSGKIVAEKLSARYSLDGPKVLHDISFTINSGERIGVVGRTGSGKSSLTLSLLRCIFTEGDVYYDGLKTSTINLDALRSNITIIPQVPELLSGSLRYNLDPFGQYDDATLNDALRAAGLFSLQSEMEENRLTLDSAISSGGGNLSVGQRQILALSRAIVRGSKLLILDEATSAIDYKTDTIIQSSLRNELKGDVTLITIAHRLQTIMDADKIMVLDAGRIVEFDSPKELLRNPKGKLRSLVDESGDREALYSMAGVKL